MKEYLTEYYLGDSDTLISIADYCIKQRFNFDSALLYAEVATIVNPVNVDAWNMKGIVCSFLENYPLARECFKTALNQSPVRSKSGSLKKAKIYLNNIIKKDKNDWVYDMYPSGITEGSDDKQSNKISEWRKKRKTAKDEKFFANVSDELYFPGT